MTKKVAIFSHYLIKKSIDQIDQEINLDLQHDHTGYFSGHRESIFSWTSGVPIISFIFVSFSTLSSKSRLYPAIIVCNQSSTLEGMC